MAAATAATTPQVVQEFMSAVHGKDCKIQSNTVDYWRSKTTKFVCGGVEVWLAPTNLRQLKLVVDGSVPESTLAKVEAARGKLFAAAMDGAIRPHEWRKEDPVDSWKVQTIWAGFKGDYSPAHFARILPEGLVVGTNGNFVFDKDTQGINSSTAEKPNRDNRVPVMWYWQVIDGTPMNKIRIPTHDADMQMGATACVVDPGAGWKKEDELNAKDVQVLVIDAIGRNDLSFPGGRMEGKDGSASTAAKRETLEETGVTIPGDAEELTVANSDWEQNGFTPGRNETSGYIVPGAAQQSIQVEQEELHAAFWVTGQDLLDGKVSYTYKNEKGETVEGTKTFGRGMRETFEATLAGRGLEVVVNDAGYKVIRAAATPRSAGASA